MAKTSEISNLFSICYERNIGVSSRQDDEDDIERKENLNKWTMTTSYIFLDICALNSCAHISEVNLGLEIFCCPGSNVAIILRMTNRCMMRVTESIKVSCPCL